MGKQILIAYAITWLSMAESAASNTEDRYGVLSLLIDASSVFRITEEIGITLNIISKSDLLYNEYLLKYFHRAFRIFPISFSRQFKTE